MSRLALPPSIAEEMQREGDLLKRVVFSPNLLNGSPVIFKPLPAVLSPGQDPNEREFVSVWVILQLMVQGMPDAHIIKGMGWMTPDDLEACREWFRRLCYICKVTLSDKTV